jgi:flavin reductase (DIM6/NTAB) family NADH-FMN oxidoreductase RutF
MAVRRKKLPSVTTGEYVAAIAQHVASVCVITTEVDGRRYGLTATAVASVSAQPPRLLVCINRKGLTHDRILEAGHFCVNVLNEHQEHVAKVFAGMGGEIFDRFQEGRWTTLVTGAPVLEEASAVYYCEVGEVSDQYSHSVIFGDVVAVTHVEAQDTLLYGVRRFRQLRKAVVGLGKGEAGQG